MIPKGLKLRSAIDDEPKAEGASPCPFCGSDAIVIHRFDSHGRRFFRLVCRGCGAWGPPADEVAAARCGWERRAK